MAATLCSGLRTLHLGVAGLLTVPTTVLVLLCTLGGRIPARPSPAPRDAPSGDGTGPGTGPDPAGRPVN
ncbi:hypothetical protein FHX74_002758 [Friedmanniella endophytica]|uniref:Uncharacterized protein n=1 Tax=Microlunatus kandeliicorticis TaxID=1759536 RepID=A0A7W3ITZ0_9ACTN|nr:hypothetical protein [Microlunatus kandeliicorticis]MBA8795130.1 hypothetical protein [Microlunatus kandeliicorticis]